MNVPQKTTHIKESQFLFIVVVCGVFFVGLVAWLTAKPTQPCSHNLAMIWEGEYPEPVVFIEKDTTLTGFRDECLVESVECTIASGLYHPWAKGALRYALKKESVIFEAKQAFRSEQNHYQKGQHISIDAQLTQQVCLFRVGEDRWQDECPSADGFVLVSGDLNKMGRQFFEGMCTEGHRAWIEVNATLFEQEGISRGVLQGYGRVAPPSP